MPDETITLKLVAQDLATGNISKAIGGIDKLAKRGGIAGSVFQGIGMSMGMMLNPLSLATMAFDKVTEFMSTAIDEARAFEDQMATVNTIAHLSDEALGDLGQSIQDLAIERGKQTDELTAGLYDLVSAGIDASDAMGVLKDATTLSIGSLSTTNEAVDLLTSTLNAYQFEVSESTRITDIWAKSVEVGKVTAADLASAVSQVLPVASAMGVEVEEVAASMAYLSARGSEAGEVAQYMRQALGALLKPTKELSKLQENLGLNFAEIAKNEGVVVALQRLRDAVGGDLGVMGKMLGRIQGLSYALTVTGENFEDFQGTLKEMSAPGAAADQMAERTDTMEFQVGRLNAAAEVFNQTAGKGMVRTIADIATVINDDLIPGLGQFAEDLRFFVQPGGQDLAKFEAFWDEMTVGLDESSEATQKLRDRWVETAAAVYAAGQPFDALLQLMKLQLPLQVKSVQYIDAARKRYKEMHGEALQAGQTTEDALAAAEAEAKAFAEVLEQVADDSLPSVRDAAKEAQKAIHLAFKQDTIPALRRQIAHLEQQRKRAVREQETDALALIDSDLARAQTSLDAARTVRRGYMQEIEAAQQRRKEHRQEEAAIDRVARRFGVRSAKVRRLLEEEGGDIDAVKTKLTEMGDTKSTPKVDVKVDDAELTDLEKRLGIISRGAVAVKLAVQRSAGPWSTNPRHTGTGRPPHTGGRLMPDTTYGPMERGEYVQTGNQRAWVTTADQASGGLTINIGYVKDAHAFAEQVGPELERWRRRAGV